MMDFTATCPIPITDYPTVLLAHGSGGKLMHSLIEKMIAPTFSNPLLDTQHDGAVFPIQNLPAGSKLAFTTDSYVVQPLFFPGGNIGTLAVNGTVNDLAMCGARPLYLSVGFILEEGLPMETLWQVIQAMKESAAVANIQIVTGDTKVVDRGKGDGIFINTAGLGVVEYDTSLAPTSVQPGDAIIVSGDIGRHGIAIMASRSGLDLETTVESDCAPLVQPVLKLLQSGVEVHCLRDATRGGLATTLVEIARTSGLHLHIDEHAIAIRDDVRAVCELLGLDPLHIANEGRFIAIVRARDAALALSVLRHEAVSSGASVIGCVQANGRPVVTMSSFIGATRIIDMLSGDQLPRIC
jgi:hydrogenase expression/formation protein HypE